MDGDPLEDAWEMLGGSLGGGVEGVNREDCVSFTQLLLFLNFFFR